MPNLLETLDAALALYAPVLARMMADNPGFHGINTVIGRDEPAAYPVADVPAGYSEGYRDDVFEPVGAKALKPLVAPTYELIAACPLIAEIREPLSAFARRTSATRRGNKASSKSAEISVAIGNRLGGLFARRAAHCINAGGLFYVDPASLVITTKPGLQENQIRSLKAAAHAGIAEVAAYLADNGLVLNSTSVDRLDVVAWVSAFPEPGKVDIELVGEGIYRMHTSSRLSPGKTLATEDFARTHTDVIDVLRESGFDVKVIEPPMSEATPADTDGPMP